MFILLLPLTWILLFLLNRDKNNKNTPVFKCIITTIQVSLLVVSCTEVLSVFTALTHTCIAVYWTCVDLLLLVLLFRKKTSFHFFETQILQTLSRLGIFYSLLMLTIFVLLILIGIAGYLSPPNTSDAMTYHMGRVVYWANNQTLDHFQSNHPSQLFHPPFAEYLIFQTFILSQSDQYANLIQYFCFVITIICVFGLSRQLNHSNKQSLFCVFLAATIPMAIAQSNSTQTDMVTSMWVCMLMYFALLISKKPSPTNLFYFSSALALGILTKSTFYILSLPVLLWTLWNCIQNYQRQLFKFTLLLFTVILTVNAGQFIRNYLSFGTPIYAEQGIYLNTVFSASQFASNITRNVALHLYLPDAKWNSTLLNCLSFIHERLLHISINDTRTTWESDKFTNSTFSLHEDYVGNFIHLVLGVSALLLTFSSKKKATHVKQYATCILCAFYLFSFILKWQPWHSRLQLPFFFLLIPLIGFVVSNKTIKVLTYLSLTITSVFIILYNPSKSLLGERNIFHTSRDKMYFVNNSDSQEVYLIAIAQITSSTCQTVGIDLYGGAWEYPLTYALYKDGKKFSSLHEEGSGKAKDYSTIFIPCEIITVNAEALLPNIYHNGRTYQKRISEENITIYEEVKN